MKRCKNICTIIALVVIFSCVCSENIFALQNYNGSNITIKDNIKTCYNYNTIESIINDLVDVADEYGYLTKSFMNENIVITGPYRIYTQAEDNVSINKYLYTIINNSSTVLGYIMLYSINSCIVGEYKYDTNWNFNIINGEILDIIAENESGLYILNNDLSAVLVENYQHTNNSNNRLFVNNSIIIADNILRENDIIKITKNVISPTRITNSVPLVVQGSYSCHEACIASVASAYDTNYSLTAEDVDDDIEFYFGDYAFYYQYSTEAADIETVIDTIYFSNGQHYTLSFTSGLSINSYKSIIDNGCVIMANSENSSGAGHVTVMCGYTNRSLGGVIVNMMDPFSETFRLITWSSGSFAYSMGISTLTLSDYVITYY